MTTPAEDYEMETGKPARYRNGEWDTDFIEWLEAERTKWKEEANKHKAMALYVCNWIIDEYPKYTNIIPNKIMAEAKKYLEENKEITQI
jgi:hypothetical protein